VVHLVLVPLALRDLNGDVEIQDVLRSLRARSE
jgi:hypothetical protein